MTLNTAHSSNGKIGPIISGVLDVNGNAGNAVVQAVVIVDGSGNIIVPGGSSSPVAPYQVTPAAGTASTIVTGGTAVTIVTGPVNGGYIVNPANTAGQGVTAESAYIDPVGTPGSTDAAANGTTIVLAAGQSFSIPPLKAGSVIKANAATSGHKLSVVVW